MKFDEVKLNIVYFYSQDFTDWTVFYKREGNKLFYKRFLVHENKLYSLKFEITKKMWNETRDDNTHKLFFAYLKEIEPHKYSNIIRKVFE